MEEISDCVACGANGISKRVNVKENLITRYGSPKDVKTYMAKADEIIKGKGEIFGEKA